MEKVREQALLLGQRKTLVGVITHASASGPPDRPTIVILNAGIIHRVGPNRLHVLLARAAAALGYTTVRFDLSGVGDSDSRADGLPPFQASQADIREALDSLEETRQVRRVVLAGLCSGADQSVAYAGTDPRVVGVVLLDPSIPSTFRHHLYHYARQVLRPSSWLNLARGSHPLWRSLRERLAPPAERSAGGQPTLDNPEVRAFLERAYRSCVDRGVQMLAVCTGLEGRHAYREHLLHAFPNVPFGKLLRLEYFKDSDHTFVLEAQRARLIGMIVDWLEKAPFAAPAASPAVTAPPHALRTGGTTPEDRQGSGRTE